MNVFLPCNNILTLFCYSAPKTFSLNCFSSEVRVSFKFKLIGDSSVSMWQTKLMSHSFNFKLLAVIAFSEYNMQNAFATALCLGISPAKLDID